jgi:hypothetical protein
MSLTPEETTRLATAITEAVIATIDKMMNTGINATKNQRLEARILKVLATAPAMVADHPALEIPLKNKSMPKTLLRHKLGNNYPNFDGVLDDMVAGGRLLTRTTAMYSKSRRSMQFFGLP